MRMMALGLAATALVSHAAEPWQAEHAEALVRDAPFVQRALAEAPQPLRLAQGSREALFGDAAPAEATPAADPTTSASTAPAKGSKVAVINGCETEIESNDAMQYNVNSITVPASCSEFKITLKHVGKMPVAAMGHNVVITTSDNMQQVVADGMAAGLEADYVKAGDDKVIAHTKMIGGGETTSVTFDVSKIQGGGPYKFFCSFPGHAALMNGSISVE